MLFNLAFIGLIGLIGAIGAIGQDIRPGTYQIYNAAQQSLLRSYPPGDMLFVSMTRENPGPFSVWRVDKAESGFTVMNMGLNTYAAGNPAPGESLATRPKADYTTRFAITAAGDGVYNIKVPNANLVWSLDQPYAPFGKVVLLPAQGAMHQQWRLISMEDDIGAQQEVLGRVCH